MNHRSALPAMVALFGLAGPGAAQLPVPRYPTPAETNEYRSERRVLITARDGVKLATDLYLPVGASGRLPTILIRTPYNKTTRGAEITAARFARRGYVVAVQDVRGKYESGGDFVLSGSDRQDGYDTIDWIVKQPWSNGKVGTYGCSYLGETQVTAASARHPAHLAMVPQAASNIAEIGTIFKGGVYRGGALELSSGADWLRGNGAKVRPVLLPAVDSARFAAAAPVFDLAPKPIAVDFVGLLQTLPMVTLLDRMKAAPSDWAELVSALPKSATAVDAGMIQPGDRFDTPALFIDSWYDYGPANTLRLFNRLRTEGASQRSRDHVFAVIGPTTHCAYERAAERTVVGHRDVGDARLDFLGLYLRWFDHWLKDAPAGLGDLPKLQLYVMGRNQWRGESEWPLARTVFTKYYLRSGGRANSRFGDGLLSTTAPAAAEPNDSYSYDPGTPVPSIGGPDFGANNPALPPGALDQAAVEARHDVLVYSTPPVEQGIEVTGPIRLELFVSSDALDTDFTGKLVDVHPDGRAFNVQEGILRARYREGFDRVVKMESGKVYRIEVDLEVTSNYFAPGHRIRLEVSSSNFPRFDRNLNTGGDNVTETTWRVARNTIHHNARYPSHLVLPVIPGR
jgi:putative CocE/NonD family hydrolase